RPPPLALAPHPPPAPGGRPPPRRGMVHRRFAHQLQPSAAVRLEESRYATRQRPVAEVGLTRALEHVGDLHRDILFVSELRETAPIRDVPCNLVTLGVRDARRLAQRRRTAGSWQEGDCAR